MPLSKTETDVIVIGAGGAASAWGLTQMGLSVQLLEAGQRFNPYSDYRLNSRLWEQTNFPEKDKSRSFYSFAELQKLSEQWDNLRSWNHISGRMISGERRFGWQYSHVRGVGGSTLHFTGETHRMNSASLQMHSRFQVAADWPLTYPELEPWYQLAEKVVGVSGTDSDKYRPRSQPFPLPPHPPSYASQKLQQGFEKLGLSWTPNPLAVLSKPYDGRPACNYCNNCNRGCPRKDKGSADVTFIRQAELTGRCHLQPGCTVLQIEADKSDKIKGVIFIDGEGKRQHSTAKAVIIACGAVQTPRLLLLSNELQSEGLANESGLVGKNFMETLFWTSSGLYPEAIGSQRGLPSDGICWNYNLPDAIDNIIGGCRFTLATAEADLLGPIAYAQRVVKGFGRQHKTAMRKLYGNVLSVGAIGECLPHPGSFIDLDPDARDAQDRPLARIHSHLDSMALNRLQFMANKCREILQATGVKQLIEEYGTYDSFNATHVFGTCRMGNDPQKSVVNRHCQSHRWKNLFIADASVFPSSGGGESPSLTIQALAMRTAFYLAEQLKKNNI